MIKLKKGLTENEMRAEIYKYPLNEIVDTLLDYMMNEPEDVNKIIITQEQFDKYFKIRGLRVDGDGQILAERRGRPRKITTNELGVTGY